MGCCGALTHHMGQEDAALAFARANIDAWTAELDRGGLDAVIINASGCGTTVKDYGYMFREDPAYAAKAARIAALTKDITEFLADLGLPPASADADLVVAYHSACSMQHGQKITALPKQLLAQAGFTVKDVPEGASLLRLGRDLQPPAARDRAASCAIARWPTSRAPGPT